jgi:hypothetical protein
LPAAKKLEKLSMKVSRIAGWAVAGALALAVATPQAAAKDLDYKKIRDAIPQLGELGDKGAALNRKIHVAMDRITKTDSEEEALKARKELGPLLEDYLTTKVEMVKLTKDLLGLSRSSLNDQEIFDKLGETTLSNIRWDKANFKKAIKDVGRALRIPIRLQYHVVQMNKVEIDFASTKADALLAYLCKGFDLRYVVYDGEIVIYKKITPTEERFLEYRKKHPEVELRYWEQEQASGEYEIKDTTVSEEKIKSAAQRWSVESLDLSLLQESLLKVHIVETASERHNQRRVAQKAFVGVTADFGATGDAEMDARNAAAKKQLDFELNHYLKLELDGSIEMIEILQRVLGKNLISDPATAALKRILRKECPDIDWRNKDVVQALKEFGRSVGVPVQVTGIPKNTTLEIYLTLEGADVGSALSIITTQDAFRFKWKYEDGMFKFEYQDTPSFD